MQSIGDKHEKEKHTAFHLKCSSVSVLIKDQSPVAFLIWIIDTSDGNFILNKLEYAMDTF